ncbi:hypothetical protein GS966_02380 [Rhodococcus hoagii]|nr:hypothetical protein [Prescottella equi]NKS72910.1 hypothetical protein [Prescottella equi]NKZ88775.1 hypothetical protein [Prescottella equi]
MTSFLFLVGHAIFLWPVWGRARTSPHSRCRLTSTVFSDDPQLALRNMHREPTALSPVSRCLRDLWGEVFTQELRITNERLIAENSSLVEQVTELRQINNILEETWPPHAKPA